MPKFDELPEGIQLAWECAVQDSYRYINSRLDIGRIDSGSKSSEGK